MEQNTKNTLLNAGFAIILTIIIFAYSYTSAQNTKIELTNNITRLDNEILKTKQELATLQKHFNEENKKLEETLTSSINYIENKLNITRKEQQEGLKKVSGRIEQVQQESNQKIIEFEDQLKTIKIKNKDFTGIIQDVLKSVVTIRTNKGMGSGVIINSKGYVVTNFHVIDGATEAGLRTYDNKVHPITIIGAEKNSDIAVLKIQSTEFFKSLEFETSRTNIGDPVIAVGNPAGLEFSVTEGIISATERTGENGVKYVQTDVSINPGNSGGPLVNIKSKIVGINTMKKENMEGLGFAVQAEVVKQIAEQIITKYEEAQSKS